MTVLIKNITYTYIPGNPGVAGTTGSPYIPPYCVFVPGVTVTTAVASAKVQIWIPTEDNPLTFGNEAGGYFAWTTTPGNTGGYAGSGSSYTLPDTTICYNGVAAVAGVAYEPATPSQVIAYYNDGWNSHARSVSSLDNNEIFYCTVSPGTVGAFISVSKKGMDARTLGSFSHGVLIDSNGVYVYESGIKVATLSFAAIGTAELKINRTTDNNIEYTIGTGAYTSAVKCSVADGIPAYVYAYLYSGGDSLLTAGLTSGSWVGLYGSSSLTATSSLSVHDINAGSSLIATSSLSVHDINAGAVLTATSSLDAALSPLASLAATSSLFALSTIGLESNTILGAINGAGGEIAYMFQPATDLGAITTEVIESGILPATPIRFLSNLPSIVGTSALVQIAGMECIGDLHVAAPVINASFGIYGDLDVPLATVGGVLEAPVDLSGNLDAPKVSVDGIFATTKVFEGSLEVSVAVIDGTILHGNLLTGDLNIVIPRILGTFSISPENDWAANMDIPLPIVSGVIAVTLTDSVLAFSGESTCQP